MTEPENIETLEDVIKQLEYHRHTHAGWLKWYEENPDDKKYEYAGDGDHHKHVVGRYNEMIKLINQFVKWDFHK